MNEKKNISVSFTGHRNYDRSADDKLREIISSLYERGYRRFLTGMAWGFDLAAAEVVLSLKNSLPDIELIAVEPYPTFRKLFHGADAVLYETMLRVSESCGIHSICLRCAKLLTKTRPSILLTALCHSLRRYISAVINRL